MAIGQIPGNGQDAFTAFGNSFSQGLDSQSAMALRLKMQSALMRQQASAEQNKFQREDTLSPQGAGTINDLFSKIGINSSIQPGTSNQEALALGKMAEVGLMRQQMAALKSPVGPSEVKTDEVGIPTESVEKNAYGVELNKQQVPGYQEKRSQYDKNLTYVNLMTQAHSLYNELSVHNALGAGGIFNHLPEDMAAKRSQLLAINQQLAPLEASVDEGVPGGRFSAMLGDALRGSTQQPQHTASVANDLYYNGMLRAYGRMKTLGPDTVKIPLALTDTFGGLPHDINGNLIFEPRDLRVEDGNVYAGDRQTPIYNIDSGKPSIDMSTIQKLHGLGAAQANQSNPFSNDSAFQAALQKVRGKH